MLKKYEELTDEEIKKVSMMYSDKDTLAMYLYNFDEHGNYHGRQYFVSVSNDKPSLVDSNAPKQNDHTTFVGKTEPMKKVTRKPKKK